MEKIQTAFTRLKSTQECKTGQLINKVHKSIIKNIGQAAFNIERAWHEGMYKPFQMNSIPLICFGLKKKK